MHYARPLSGLVATVSSEDNVKMQTIVAKGCLQMLRKKDLGESERRSLDNYLQESLKFSSDLKVTLDRLNKNEPLIIPSIGAVLSHLVSLPKINDIIGEIHDCFKDASEKKSIEEDRLNKIEKHLELFFNEIDSRFNIYNREYSRRIG